MNPGPTPRGTRAVASDLPPGSMPADPPTASSRAANGDLSETYRQAVVDQRAGRLDEAKRKYLHYLAQRPGFAQAWTNYGALLTSQGRHLPALAAHRRALEIDPGLVAAWHNLALTQAAHGEFDDSIRIRRQLLAAEPDSAERLRDLCISLRGRGDHDEVIERVTAAEAAGLADPGCLMQRALSRLTLGDYARGFADFEHRFACGEVPLPANAPWPRWHGEPVDGRHVLVTIEQGLGDAIFACRFLPRLAARGARVTLQLKKPLHRLLARVDGIERLTAQVLLDEEYDFYTPIMSLPHLVGLHDGKPPPPRLTVPDDSRARAARIVAPFRDRFRIGVIWTGSRAYKSNHRRSTGPESFLGLAQVPGVQLFSLYKGEAHGEFINSGMAGLIVDACGNDRDFADSAALIDAMDLMITTDTAVVHVAASLGKPVWNLLSREGFWLYGRGDTTPWYPSMRLFRQARQGDWSELFQRVEAALRERLAGPAAAHRERAW